MFSGFVHVTTTGELQLVVSCPALFFSLPSARPFSHVSLDLSTHSRCATNMQLVDVSQLSDEELLELVRSKSVLMTVSIALPPSARPRPCSPSSSCAAAPPATSTAWTWHNDATPASDNRAKLPLLPVPQPRPRAHAPNSPVVSYMLLLREGAKTRGRRTG